MRKTLHLQAADPADVARAAELLRNGDLVAFPTETVYGLGANAFLADAVEGIFRAKQRPSWDPLIVHLPSVAELAGVATCEGELMTRVQALAVAFWPGPLTMLLPRTAAIPDTVTARRTLVGVRVPGHPTAQALLRAAGVPLAAPSANRFGHTSPTTAQHVLDDLDGRIDAVLDAGPCAVGVESTVLDVTSTPMILYRAGAVTPEQIEAVVGVPVQVFSADGAVLKQEPDESPASLPSPGVGLRHYAPEASVHLTAGDAASLWAAADEAVAEGNRVGVLLPQNWPGMAAGVDMQPWGRWDNVESLAASLFLGLRALEQRGAQVIVCPLPEPGGLRDAIRDRLLKAAKPR